MRLYLLLAAGMVCCFLSCQKEPEDILTSTACKIERIVYYDDNDPIDTVGFEYTGDRATKLHLFSTRKEVEYAGNHIVKRTYYDRGTTNVWGIDEFSYNPDSTISRVNFYVVDPALAQPFLFLQWDFTYNAGKLSMIQAKQDTSGNGPEPAVNSYFIYTGNNITQVIQNYLGSQEADTLNYTYDAKQNYFSKQPNLWLADYVFESFDGFALPIALSANNVISFGDMQGNSSTIAYEETDKQDIESMTIDGDLWSRYQYKCQ